MRLKKWLGALLLVGVFPIFLLACGADEPTATPQPTPGPDTQATLEALAAQDAAAPTPTPTPVNPVDRGEVLNFAKGHGTIAGDWDKFHAAFDIWREVLAACDASTFQVTLNGFAGYFTATTEDARGLPRDPIVRGLADNLIDAAELEQGALRQLRDNWRPGDPQIFEAVDAQRSSASDIREQVGDDLTDLQRRASPQIRGLLDSYSLDFKRINDRWDKFHADYDLLRSREGELSSSLTVESLSLLIDDFRVSIIQAIGLLPTTGLTRPATEVLAGAAQEEDLALRRLRGTFVKLEEGQAGGEVTFQPQVPAPFDDFDAQLVRSNASRREATQALAHLVDRASTDNEAAANKFATAYNLLTGKWDQFHQGYDKWRSTEGGCDRAAAIDTLGAFSIDFGKIATRVRELPRAPFLRPLGELIVEAAEREEQSLREMRNIWRPFDTEVYQALDRERSAVGKLRRQVASGIQDLLPRYDISPRDLAQ